MGWGGRNSGLPAWKKDPVMGIAAAPSQHIFDITRRWMAPNGDVSKGIDGWRLDAPNDVHMPFGKFGVSSSKKSTPMPTSPAKFGIGHKNTSRAMSSTQS